MKKPPKWVTVFDTWLEKVPTPIDGILAVIAMTMVFYLPWAGFWTFVTWDFTWVFSGWSRVSLGLIGLMFTYVIIFQV